jgi:hypothetical protein
MKKNENIVVMNAHILGNAYVIDHPWIAQVTRPQVPCVTQKGPKSWICGNGQKFGAAPRFQH